MPGSFRIKISQHSKTGIYNRNLTVLCPGIILETEANFKLLSPLLEIQTKDDPSCIGSNSLAISQKKIN